MFHLSPALTAFAPVLLEQKMARLRNGEDQEKGARRYRTVFEASETRR